METITVNEVKTTHSSETTASTAGTIVAASEHKLVQGSEPESGNSSKLQLVGKALRMFVRQGPAFAIRRAIWRYYFERFERQRKALSEGGKAAPVIQFLGHDFELHRSNEGVTEEMRLYGVHEPSATEDYLAQLSQGDH